MKISSPLLTLRSLRTTKEDGQFKPLSLVIKCGSAPPSSPFGETVCKVSQVPDCTVELGISRRSICNMAVCATRLLRFPTVSACAGKCFESPKHARWNLAPVRRR